MRRLVSVALLAASLGLALPPVQAPWGTPVAVAQSASATQDFEVLMQTYRRALSGAAPDGWSELAGRFDAMRGRLSPAWSTRLEVAELECLARAGDKGQLKQRYQALASRSNASDWVLYAAGQGLRQVDAAHAREAYTRLVRDHASSPLVPDALIALGELALPGNPALAVQPLKRLADRYAGHPAAEHAVYLLGTQGPVASRLSWLRVYRHRYGDGANKVAVARALSKEAGLSAGERLDLAGDLIDTADYGPALQLLKGMSSGLALFRQGRAAWRMGNPDQGAALIREAIVVDPDLRVRGLIVLGQIAEKRKQIPQAIALYRQAAEDQSETGLDALCKLGALYRKGDDDANASEVDRTILDRFSSSEDATEARWRFIWRAYRAGHLDEAKVWASSMGYETLVKVEGPGGAYWLGRFQERDGKTAAAAATYREIVRRKPRSYYGWRARFRLAAIEDGQGDPGFQVHPVEVEAPAEDLTPLLEGASPRSARAASYLRQMARFPGPVRELAYLGLVEPALAHAKQIQADADLQAWLAMQGGRYSQAISLSQGEDPYLSYPLGFYPLMKAAAEPQGIDPLLLMSLVKQESSFDPKARSWVGALGLAQLMPFTADWVGRHVPGPVRSLLDPFWNLKLGAFYLKWVQQKLMDQPLFAVAAYNAGPNAVKKWMAQFGNEDVDVWVELIPYPETRHYVKKVFGNLWTYQMLYGRK